MPDQTPHFPVTPEQLGETARARCEAAGASIVHVHCRNDDGTNTHDVARFREALTPRFARASDLIVQFSTGGAIGMTPRGAGRAAGAAPGDGDADLRHGELRRRRLREQLPDHARHPGRDARVRRAPRARDLRHRATSPTRSGWRAEGAADVPAARRLRARRARRRSTPASNTWSISCARSAAQAARWSVAGIGRAQLPLAAGGDRDGRPRARRARGQPLLQRGRLARNDELVARVARIAAGARAARSRRPRRRGTSLGPAQESPRRA